MVEILGAVGVMPNLYVIGGLAVLVAIGAAGLWGYVEGRTACATQQLKANVEAQKDHAQLETKIMRLPDPDLDKRLARWLRD